MKKLIIILLLLSGLFADITSPSNEIAYSNNVIRVNILPVSEFAPASIAYSNIDPLTGFGFVWGTPEYNPSLYVVQALLLNPVLLNGFITNVVTNETVALSNSLDAMIIASTNTLVIDLTPASNYTDEATNGNQRADLTASTNYADAVTNGNQRADLTSASNYADEVTNANQRVDLTSASNYTDEATNAIPKISSASNVVMARLSGSTYSNAQHMQDIFHSTGWSGGGVITRTNNTNVNVSAGNGFIRATDSRTLSYGSSYKFPGGTKPILSTSTNAIDIIQFVYDGTSLYGVVSYRFQ